MAKTTKLSGLNKSVSRKSDPLKTAKVGTLLSAIIGCSVIYADICDTLMRRDPSGGNQEECVDIVFADARIRAIVRELRRRLSNGGGASC